MTVGDNANKQVTASVLETDKRNDLALLRISSTQMASAETKSLISKLNVQKLGLKIVPLASGGLMRSDDIELGEKSSGFWISLRELYSNTIKVTGGMMSAVKGMVMTAHSSRWMLQFNPATLVVLSMMRTETSLA